MAISPLGALPPARPSPPVQSAVQPIQPVTAPAPLAPAVKVDIRSNDKPPAERPAPEPAESKAVEQNTQRIRIDQDTKTIVYQVVDPSSGDVVVQLPDATVLKARAYADAAAAKAEKPEQPFEKTA
ncbi:hypothetical protein [Methylobacterium marchantiae]|uniref:Flagellar protein FlaG n=1 Tax=Methylobacterium marchantiae TaxID=600331 RepID=A0ABW3WW31_9HYPH|nr:hypothetical protein AIGOOFII_0931 [Methylobacterium marchantiae]